MAKEIRITSVRNAHGCKIKKCCASCQHKCIESDGTRVCASMMLKVQQKFKCKKWQMSDGLKNAGKCDGKVKRKEYLIYVQEIRSAERLRVGDGTSGMSDDIQNGIITEQQRKTLEEIRKMFTEKFGSIYAME